jgi:indole-3-glycerol phosphate synthase
VTDLLAPILERKRREIERRKRHGSFVPRVTEDRAPAALAALKRDRSVRIIAEIKFASPSEGRIRERTGGAQRIARAYVGGGASAISVLCDRVGFDGSVLDLRRVANGVAVPVLFKEFVLDPIQIDLARVVGASMVLLLVRALSQDELVALIQACRDRGMLPLVEAADEGEVDRALSIDAPVVGVNARDLSSFKVDPVLAARAIQKIPENRVAVYMSGVSSADELRRVAERADAVLIGTALMRATDPGQRLREMLER